MIRGMSFKTVLAVVCSGLVGASVAAGAQVTPHVPPVPNLGVDTSADTGTIRLNVEVTAKGGMPVPGLAQGDFALTDNGSARTLTGFRELSPAKEPVELILIFDAVNARFQTVAYERLQVEKYLKAAGNNLPLPFTVGFLTDKGIKVQQGFSRDGAALADAIETNAPGLRQITRSAGIWGADERLQISQRGIQQVIAYASSLPGRKIVIWASPGWPLLSGPHIDLDARQQDQVFSSIVGYSRAMRQGNVTLFSLNPLGPEEPMLREDYYQSFLHGISNPRATDLGDLSVQVLALQSGGQVINSTDLGGAIKRWIGETNTWYELTFEAPPAERSNEYHHIAVRVDKPGLTARTRDGYYAQPANTAGH